LKSRGTGTRIAATLDMFEALLALAISLPGTYTGVSTDALIINASNVTVIGAVVRGYLGPVEGGWGGSVTGMTSYSRPSTACVVVINASNVTLIGVEALCSNAILVVNSSNVRVVSPVLRGAEWLEPRLRGIGIFIDSSTGVEIVNASVRGFHDCVYIQYSRRVAVEGGRVSNCRYGIHVMFSAGVNVTRNRAEDSYVGIAAMYSRDVLVVGNEAVDNREWSEGFGILVVQLMDSHIAGNVAEGNVVGLVLAYMGRRAGTEVVGNRVVGNFIGIGMIGLGARDLVVRNNTVLGNVLDAAHLGIGGRFEAVFQGNAWSASPPGRYELRSTYAELLRITQMQAAYMAASPARFVVDLLGGPTILVDLDARRGGGGVEASLTAFIAAATIYAALRRL